MAGEEDDGRTPRSGPQGFLHPQAVLPSESHIQYEAGQAVWALAPQELAGGREGFDLHPERADEAG
jgi:hypothetical protein